MDLGDLQNWRADQGGDKRQRLERLAANLQTAMDDELTPCHRQMLQMHFFHG